MKSFCETLAEQLALECDAMARYAFSSGLKIPKPVQELLQNCPSRPPDSSDSPPAKTLDLSLMTTLHTALARLVAPATPQTIALLHEQNCKQNRWCAISPVPIVRKLMCIALSFLSLWIILSLFPDVDGRLDLTNSNRLILLLDEVFILLAAGIGAIFSILFQINRFVVRGRYNPKYDSTYWTRLVLGIVAGMILAFLIPSNSTSNLKEFTIPTLAMLGGFSVTVVHRILLRLVAAVESLVQGDTRDIIEANIESAKAEMDARQTEERTQHIGNLLKIKNLVSSNGDPEVLTKAIDDLINQTLPGAPQISGGGKDPQ